MSGIYIPGMEMPKNCSECGQFRWSNLLQSEVCRIAEAIGDDGIFQSASEGIDDRPSWCPLFPVPEHGRLMDKDAFIDGCEALSSNDPHDIAGMEIIKFFMEEIVPTPTVIPSDLVKEVTE